MTDFVLPLKNKKQRPHTLLQTGCGGRLVLTLAPFGYCTRFFVTQDDTMCFRVRVNLLNCTRPRNLADPPVILYMLLV